MQISSMRNCCLGMASWRTKTGSVACCSILFKTPFNRPHQQFIFHCILIGIYLTSTSGCWRRQVQADDDDVASTTTTTTTTTTTQPLSHHRLDCHLDEAAYAGCLNGGECFVIELHTNSRHVQCSCTSEWQGERCESLYIDPDHWSIEEAKEQATKLAIVLAFGITVAVLLIILITFTVVYMRRRRRHVKDERKKKEEEKRRHDDLQAGRITTTSPSNSISSHQQQRTIIIPISSV